MRMLLFPMFVPMRIFDSADAIDNAVDFEEQTVQSISVNGSELSFILGAYSIPGFQALDFPGHKIRLRLSGDTMVVLEPHSAPQGRFERVP